MRLLPVRPDHVRVRAARHQCESHRSRYRRGDVREHLPLRHVWTHSRRDQTGSQAMTNVTRRQFVTVLAAAGGGLLLGYRVEREPRAVAMAATPSTFAPNAFIRVASDGR